MFRQLKAWKPKKKEHIRELAKVLFSGSNLESQSITAGYTYLGQFIAHDITFDPSLIVKQEQDPTCFKNFRTPSLDLDSIYGGGPRVSPFLYRSPNLLYDWGAFDHKRHKTHFRVVTRELRVEGRKIYINDLPRYKKEDAIIPDPRNDENILISQLHTFFLLLHNKFADNLIKQGCFDGSGPMALFNRTRQLVRWHYQWIVLNDYLPQIVTKKTLKKILKEGRKYYKWKKLPYIPLEFAGAAFRFGHVQVQKEYTFNTLKTDPGLQPLFDEFSSPTSQNLKFVDWRKFFEDTEKCGIGANPAQRILPRMQADLRTTRGLGGVNEGKDPTEVNLAIRDLIRGQRFGLPSGQAVARRMGIKPCKIQGLSKSLCKSTPLWFYILYEAQIYNEGEKLGPVGGRIVAEVLIGLLQGDPSSFLNANPKAWKPLVVNKEGKCTMVELLKYAGVFKHNKPLPESELCTR